MESVLKMKVEERITKMTPEQVMKVLLFMAGLKEADAECSFEKKGYEPEDRVR